MGIKHYKSGDGPYGGQSRDRGSEVFNLLVLLIMVATIAVTLIKWLF